MKTLYENGWIDDSIELPLNYGDSVTCKSVTLVPKQANDPNKYPHADVYLKMEDDGKSIIAHLTKEIDSVIFKDLMDTSNSKLTDIRIEFAVGGGNFMES